MSKIELPPLDKLNPREEWAPWKPTKDDPWSAKWAAHLLPSGRIWSHRK